MRLRDGRREFLAHQVLGDPSCRPSISLQLTDVEITRGTRGREVISLDLSEYGDPLHTRIVRLPFSAYHKPLQYRAAQVLNEISRACRQCGTALVLENMLPHLFSGRVCHLLWVLGALETTEVGICLDTGHAHLSGDLGTVAHKLSGHLWMMHATDNHGRHDDHLPPGDGQIDWLRLLRQMRTIGFHGAIILELAGHIDQQTTLDGARRARRFLRNLSHRLEQPRVDSPRPDSLDQLQP